MREIRTSGSEGGAGRKPRSYLYQLTVHCEGTEIRVSGRGLSRDGAWRRWQKDFRNLLTGSTGKAQDALFSNSS
jgi:hypothetical protein